MTLGNILAWEWSTAKNRNNVILPLESWAFAFKTTPSSKQNYIATNYKLSIGKRQKFLYANYTLNVLFAIELLKRLW